MKKIKKIIFWAALIFIGLSLIVPLFWIILDLEFVSDSIRSSFKKFMFFAVPIAMLLTLVGTIKSKDTKSKIVVKITGTISVAFLAIFIMFMSKLDMCAWTDRQVLYVNKSDSNTKIIVRDFGCGAWDSEPPKVEVFRVEYFTKYFIQYKKIDITKINKNEWINA